MREEHSNPYRNVVAPKWLFPLALVAIPIGLFGIIFARLAASNRPNPATGQIYQVYFSKSETYWYIDHWHYVVYKTLTIPGTCVFYLFAVVLVYNLYLQYWPWRRR